MENEEMLRYLLGKLSHEELVDQLVNAFKEFHPEKDEQEEALQELVRYFHARSIILMEKSIEDIPEEDRAAVSERVDSIIRETIVELRI